MASGGNPRDFILASTADIASTFAFCASRAVRARDSAAIDTQTRSGGNFTTPSPVVTIAGASEAGEAGCAATAGA
jgi:hypothetical protein